MMGREENVQIFKDTEKLCKTNGRLKMSLEESKKKQYVLLEEEVLHVANKQIYHTPCRITVSKKRTLEAASAYNGEKVCVLNFASATNPGGGVTKGSSAQEECICRVSGLYFCLNSCDMWEDFYGRHRNEHNPLHNDDIIYTPDITVFKCDAAKPTLMHERNWYDVNIITCAAPNLREKPANAYNSGDGDKAVKVTDKELLEIHEKRLRRILDVAVAEGNEIVILGAFGCGAFQNNPEVVARAAKNVISEYQHAFKTIEFAIYCSPKDERNYQIFDRVIRKSRETYEKR